MFARIYVTQDQGDAARAHRLLRDARTDAQQRARAGRWSVLRVLEFSGSVAAIAVHSVNLQLPSARDRAAFWTNDVVEVWAPGEVRSTAPEAEVFEAELRWSVGDPENPADSLTAGVA